MAAHSTGSGQAKLELRDIVVRRDGRTQLAIDHLAVAAGGVLAVIGPNGAGKSTLLQVAGLLRKPDAGDVTFDGEPAASRSTALRRRIAITMQHPILLHRSVLDNAALGLKLRGIGGRERRTRAMEWLARFGVAELAGRPAHRLSGGEAQRVCLARAFALGPELLLLDEPFSGLDQQTREELLDDLSAVLASSGVTAVLVTHDRDEALRFADQVAVLIKGELRQVGSTAEVFRAPADEEVAAFVGVETIVDGQIVDIEDGLAVVEVGGQRLTAAARELTTGAVRVCIRPEDVTVQPLQNEGQPTSARNTLRGTVDEVRIRGAEARVVIDCGFPLVASLTYLSVKELDLEPGRPVAAVIKATALHLLPL